MGANQRLQKKDSSCRSNRGQQFRNSLRVIPADVEDKDKDQWHKFQEEHTPGKLPMPETTSCKVVSP